MTDEPGLLLAIQTADCIPVLVADRKRRAVAAFHAGWRGHRQAHRRIRRRPHEAGLRLAAAGSRRRHRPRHRPLLLRRRRRSALGIRIAVRLCARIFKEVFDSDPVRKKYPMLFLTQRAPGHSPIGPSLHVDLIEANRRQLLAAGLKPRSIQVVGGCTQCHTDLFFSHRASHGHTGRMMAVIGIRR